MVTEVLLEYPANNVAEFRPDLEFVQGPGWPDPDPEEDGKNSKLKQHAAAGNLALLAA